MKQPFKISIFVLLLNLVYSSTSIDLSIGQGGIFSIPFQWESNINEKLSIKHINRIYHTQHSHFRNFQTSNTRSFNRYASHLTGITEISVIKYKNNNLSLSIGKDYIDTNNSLFFSNNSFSLNHMMFGYSKNRLDYHYYIIRLNDEIEFENNKVIRWLYYRNLSFKVNQKISFKFSEAMLSATSTQGIDWYYLTPGALLIGESENNNNNLNSPNSFFGFGVDYLINPKYTFRGRLIIDDFQKSSAGRDMYEDVFGFLLGLDYKRENFSFSIEYQYASPWLYTNMNFSAHYQYHNQPIGLRYPNSHILEMSLEHQSDNALITSTIIFGEKAEQDIGTQWNPENNNIDNFNFTHTLKPELYLKYDFLSDNNFIPSLILFHNWRESDKTDLILEWSFSFKNKEEI